MSNSFKQLAMAVAEIGIGFGTPKYNPEPVPFEREDRVNRLVDEAYVEAGTHGLDLAEVDEVLKRVSEVVNRMLLWRYGDHDWWETNSARVRVATDLNRLGNLLACMKASKSVAKDKPLFGAKMAGALATLAMHPNWTNKAIAEAVGCSEEYLSRSKKFKTARSAQKGANAMHRRRGSKRDGILEAEN